MYKIYFADMGRATGNHNMGKRPVVSLNVEDEDYVKVMKVTSRMRNDEFHVRMNNFLVHGYCDVSHTYRIKKKYLLDWIRDCTVSETEGINEKRFGKPIST